MASIQPSMAWMNETKGTPQPAPSIVHPSTNQPSIQPFNEDSQNNHWARKPPINSIANQPAKQASNMEHGTNHAGNRTPHHNTAHHGTSSTHQ
mmetsp:Transcript_15596/g.37204  ORF Transcript_15596/g.37204 Transcript_15596/m.37204 type:complete len:93 (-) Transcript_15596:934-1212(-)